MAELREDKRALQVQQESLEVEMRELRAQLANAMPVAKAVTSEPPAVVTQVTPDVPRTGPQSRGSNHEVEDQDSEGSSQRSQSSESANSQTDSDSSQLSEGHQRRQRSKKDPHPPGFRTLLQRVDKFSGHQGDDDFEIWLVDFKEATKNCGLQDKQRVK